MDAVYESIVQARQRGEGAILVTVIEAHGLTPARVGAKMLVRTRGERVGTVGGGALEREVTGKAQGLLASRQSLLQRYSLSDDDRAIEGEPTEMVSGATVTLFFDYIGYASDAYVFGGGHVGRALARLLGALPYHVTVVDPRPEVADNLEGARRVIASEYASALDDTSVAPGGYFIIATPSHEADYDVLRHIMASDWQPAYVGMIGSTRKTEAIVGRLRQELGDVAPWEVLYSPIGLDVGGATPEEIAVSIAAEMQAVRYDKAGHRHMRLGHSRG